MGKKYIGYIKTSSGKLETYIDMVSGLDYGMVQLYFLANLFVNDTGITVHWKGRDNNLFVSYDKISGLVRDVGGYIYFDFVAEDGKKHRFIYCPLVPFGFLQSKRIESDINSHGITSNVVKRSKSQSLFLKIVVIPALLIFVVIFIWFIVIKLFAN